MEDIINYSVHEIKNTIENGTEIYEFVEHKIHIQPVGIVPLHQQEGYFLLCEGSTKNTWVYQYRLSFFEKHNEKYRSIITQFIDVWQRTIVNSYENIKTELIKNRSELPNPAVYALETDYSFPIEETLLPIAKRSLVKYISDEMKG